MTSHLDKKFRLRGAGIATLDTDVIDPVIGRLEVNTYPFTRPLEVVPLFGTAKHRENQLHPPDEKWGGSGSEPSASFPGRARFGAVYARSALPENSPKARFRPSLRSAWEGEVNGALATT